MQLLSERCLSPSAAQRHGLDVRLDGVVQKISCPFLLMHGEGDEQIPLELAHTVVENVGARDKTLKIFSREEGGYHHCQIDNVSIGVAYMWDWIQSRLLRTTLSGS